MLTLPFLSGTMAWFLLGQSVAAVKVLGGIITLAGVAGALLAWYVVPMVPKMAANFLPFDPETRVQLSLPVLGFAIVMSIRYLGGSNPAPRESRPRYARPGPENVLADRFARGEIDAGFICGLPYVNLSRSDALPVVPIAAPANPAWLILINSCAICLGVPING